MDNRSLTALDRERNSLFRRLDRGIEARLVAMGFLWLVLYGWDLARGLPPLMDRLAGGIRMLFFFELAVKMWVAPRKTAYLKNDWPVAASLAIPGFRVLRARRVLRHLRAMLEYRNRRPPARVPAAV